MKKKFGVVLTFVAVLCIAAIAIYFYNLKAVSKTSEEVDFTVQKGSTYYTIIPELKSAGLIKNELCFKIYIKLNRITGLEAGIYKLNKNMSVKEIISVFSDGDKYNPDAIKITYKEGMNMRAIAKIISENTDNTVDVVYEKLNDKDYLNSLIEDYWFIDNSILNSNIYYSLEGYLYPNTYEYKNKSVSVEDIFKKMLDEMDKNLSLYKNDIISSKYSVHELLTLASIIELEGKNQEDRENIAGVFYNRLNANMSLGSDVTTYYASKIDLNERDLYQYEILAVNGYNTRSDSLAGKLPVGPISNPSIGSIKAAIYPQNNDYYYFVSDKNGKSYFAKTYQEHLQNKNKLIEEGLWYTY